MTDFEADLRDLTDQDILDLYERCGGGAGYMEADTLAAEIERRNLDV